MSLYVSKKEYMLRKMLKNNNNIVNDVIEISDEEAIDLHFFNYFIGLTNPSKTSWDISELNGYSSEALLELTAPQTTEEDRFCIFIYPEEWGDILSESTTMTVNGESGLNQPTLPPNYNAAILINNEDPLVITNIIWT